MPVPFAMRSVNAWLDVDGRTLVDCGPRTDEGWAALVQGLAAHGLAPKDIDRVVLTHGHVDHYGNLARLQEANPALEAVAHAGDRDWIERYAFGREERLHAYRPALVRCGLSDGELRRLEKGYAMLTRMGEAARVHDEVRPRDTFDLAGARFEAMHVPGHSPGCVAFLDRAGGTLVSGDVLLERVTSNAVNLAHDEQDALARHRASLRGLAATKALRVLPGHRDPFDDASAVADRHLADIAARGERVHALLGREPQTVRALVAGLFRDLDVDLFLASSELLGHLRELERAGRAREDADGRWRAA